MDETHSFRDLLENKTDFLRIAVCVPATNAKREKPLTGIWRLTRERFLRIARDLQDNDPGRFKHCSFGDIADICDETGIENRFFRLNRMVAEWIDENAPDDVIFDYIIM